MDLQNTASRAATLLAKNPSLFCRLVLAKLNTKRSMPPLPVRRHIGDIVFEYDLANYRGTAPMYFGSYALLVIEAMKRFLKPGDTFFDVGANIGYLSAVGAHLAGRRGQVHSFEPVPVYFEKLCRLVDLNPAYNITANPFAAGEASCASTIYVTREPGQSTLVPAYKARSEIVGEVEVPVVRLDSYIERHKLDRVALIKIDAEGFELPILRGLQGYFEASGQRPPIICEIAPRAYSLMGRNVDELVSFVTTYGYSARDLIDCSTPIDLREVDHVEDVLFVAAT
jgi:FkbM family methyltransferase